MVTGAARREGLGYAFARQLALEGLNLVLVDILDDDLRSRAEELREEFAVEVRTLACDLGDLTQHELMDEAVRDLEIDVLICNHMFTPTTATSILDMQLDTHSRMIDINARGYTGLIHRYGNRMRARGRGALIIVASGAGLNSAPYAAAYSANKAFQIALGEALWYELRGTGVDVLVVIGGLMNTQGDGLSGYPRWRVSQPAPVAREVLSAVGRKHLVMPGLVNRALLLVQSRLLSRRRAVLEIGRSVAAGIGKPD
jgi:short-subunit dehydrogenase